MYTGASTKALSDLLSTKSFKFKERDMARKVFKPRKHETGRVVTTKTPYGITGDMVVTDENILSQVSIEDGMVLVHDDHGYFIVPKNRVDDGLACPLRYSDSYRDEMHELLKQLENN